jgi:hypothetical protein
MRLACKGKEVGGELVVRMRICVVLSSLRRREVVEGAVVLFEG